MAVRMRENATMPMSEKASTLRKMRPERRGAPRLAVPAGDCPAPDALCGKRAAVISRPR